MSIQINKEGRKRHIAKTITWRAFGTLGTLAIGWIITKDLELGSQIATVELITKTILYYFHERVWFSINLPNSQKRHISKTITWRLLGSIDTLIIAWVISGDPMKGFQISGIEVFLKMLMYYAHERVWHLSKFGLETKSSDDEQ